MMIGWFKALMGRRTRRARAVAALGLAGLLVVSPLAFAGSTAPVGWLGPPPSGGGGNSVTNGTDPGSASLSLGGKWWAWSAKPGSLGAVPQGYSFDVVNGGVRSKKIFLNVARNADSASAIPANAHLQADNNGEHFYADPSLAPGEGPMYVVRTRDGSLVGNGFIPTTLDGGKALITWSSTNDGKSWTHWKAPISDTIAPAPWYRTTGNPIQLADGTILQGVYTTGKTYGSGISYLLQSTDGGKTWSQRSRLNPDDENSGEFAISRTSDGKLIAVARAAEGPGNATKPMRQAYSTDGGKTWSPELEFQAPKGMANQGIMPSLVLQPNGVLVLSTGRPDDRVMISWDGTGRTWDTGKVTFSNYIRRSAVGRWMGTSGNTALVPVKSNYSLQFGDICHNIWTCEEYGQQTGVWVRRIDAVTPGKGKIDLTTGAHDGTIKLSGTVVPADPRFPEQRLAGAIDGSSAYRAAARFPDKKAAQQGLTIDLGKTYSLNRIGLMLDRGTENSAKVVVSLDGKHWTAPMVRQRRSVDYAIRYHKLGQPVQARYVKVQQGAGAPLTAINEVELYASDMWTFENDGINITPRGLTDTLHAFTSDVLMSGQHSTRRMILVDTDPNTRATATFPVADYHGLQMSFGYSSIAYGSGAVWEFLGKDASGKQVTAWRFLFSPDWSHHRFAISQWDGEAWKQIGTFPTLTPNQGWVPVKAAISAKRASFTIHGATITATDPLADVASFDAFRPSTGREVTDINMDHAYDNVRIDPLPDYTVTASPQSMIMLPQRPVTTTLHVSNNTDQAMKLPITTKAPAGYEVKGAATVTVQPNATVDVPVTVTSASAKAASGQLTVGVGKQTVAIALTATSDWARIASMAASSTAPASSPANLNSGNTDSEVWGGGGAGGWNDNTYKQFPDWVTATWDKPVTLSRVVVYTLNSKAYAASKYGVRDYDVQVKATDGAWKTVASVRGNTAGSVTSTFSATKTSAIRILITDTNDHEYSRLIAVQAFAT